MARRTIARSYIGQNRLTAAKRIRLTGQDNVKRTVVRPKKRFP